MIKLGETRENCTITSNEPHCRYNFESAGRKGGKKIVQFRTSEAMLSVNLLSHSAT